MKILPITIASLGCLLLAAATDLEKKSLKIVPEIAGDPSRSKDAQRKRDSGYSYDRPVRLQLPNRREIVRILARRPNVQKSRPFDHYGPPNFPNQALKSPSHNRHQQPQAEVQSSDSKRVPGRGQTQQGIPSPIRDHEFVEPSPIAGQNTIPFNSAAATYLPPRNQKLPYARVFPKPEEPPSRPQAHRQSQNLLGGSFSDHQQISDGAAFLTQNSQAISQLYETPATNFNYEPLPESQRASQNTAFHIVATNSPLNSAGSDGETTFAPNLPSYASGFLESREAAIRDVQSLEKDRLIVQLQRALVDARSNGDLPMNGDFSMNGRHLDAVRYAQNQPNYLQIENHQGYQGAINPSSIGPQLDRPKDNDGNPGGTYVADFGYGAANSVPEYAYGAPPSSTITTTATSPDQPQTTTTLAASTSPSAITQSPNLVASLGAASSQLPASIAPISSTSNRIPHFGFVPSIIGPTFVPNYPTYATNFVTSGVPTINQPVGASSPTHFGIPIPSPAPSQPTVPTTSGVFANTDGPSAQPPTGTPIQTIQPIRPIQTIIPINALHHHHHHHHGFNVVPAVTPVQTIPVTSTLGQPTYGLQPVVNPAIGKPIKAVYPIYYYPGLIQLQKSTASPWNYAPSYGQTRRTQI